MSYHVQHEEPRLCPRCNKVCYLSESAARHHVASKVGKRVKVYQCGAYFHVASLEGAMKGDRQPSRSSEKQRRLERAERRRKRNPRKYGEPE